MNDELPGAPEDTISRIAWIDAVCDRFEGEWRAGRPRPMPEFLRAEGIDPDSAPDLLAELGKLEVAYRDTSVVSDPAKTLTDAGADADTHTFRDVDPEAHDLATRTMLPKIPGYRVIREIARGGMGIVYLAHEPSFQREVAVKVLTDRYRGDPRAARRFLAEARLTGRLQHPGIPPVFEVGELADKSPFLAMKLIEGKTFKEVLAEGRLAPASLLVTFEHICQAVAFAHNRSIIHRDLKPANVMVGAFGEVQIMDWGLAKVLDRLQADAVAAEDPEPHEPNPDPTRVGAALGTPQYIAPEQARGETVDRRADVFGLGAILCEALTGQPPFVGRTPREVLDHAAAAEFGPALGLLDSCGADPDLVALCRKCLAPAPQGRPADASAVAKAVADIRAAADERLKKAELDRAAAETRAVEAIRRRKVLFALAAVMLVGIATTSGFALFADSESRRANGALVELTVAKKGTDAALDQVTKAKSETDIALADSQKATAAEHRATLAAMKSADAEKNAKEEAATEAKKAREAEDATLADFRATTSDVLANLLAKDAELSSEAKQFLTDLQKRWEGFSRRTGDDLRSRLIRAEGFFRVAAIQSQLGSGELALANFHNARKILEAVLVEHPETVEAMEILGYVIGDISLVWSTQNREDQLRSFQTALRLWREVDRLKPSDKKGKYMIAYTHLLIGKYHLESRKIALAEEEFGKSREIGEMLLRENVKNPLYTDMLISCGLALAQCADFSGKNPIAAYKEALVRADSALVDHPGKVSFRQAKEAIHENLGKALLDAGDGERALWHYEQASEVSRRLFRDSPGRYAFQVGVFSTRNRVATVLASSKRFDEANGHFLAAIDGLSMILEKHPKDDLLLRETILGRSNYAKMLQTIGEAKAEMEQLRHTVRLGRELLKIDNRLRLDHTIHVDSMLRLGALFDRQGLRDEWQLQIEATRDYLLQPIRLFPNDVHFADNFIGICNKLLPIYERTLSHGESRKCYRTLLGVCEGYCRNQPKDVTWKTDTAVAARNFGAFLRDLGNNEESLKWLDRAVELFVEIRNSTGHDPQIDSRLRMSYIDRAILQQNRIRYEAALKDWAAAMALSERNEHPFLRASSALALAGSGRINVALTEIEKLETLAKWPGHIWYEFGIACAIAADAEGRDKEKQRLIEASVAHFQKAVNTDVVNARLRRPLSDFAALKGNDDFRKLAEKWAEKYPLEVAPAPTPVELPIEQAPLPRTAK